MACKPKPKKSPDMPMDPANMPMHPKPKKPKK